MTDKPNLTRVWANGAPSGNVVDPDTTTPGKFSTGWQAEVPPFEHFNFIQKLQTQGLAHINEQGIPVWDTDTVYPVNALVKGSDGTVYKALSSQAGNDPVSSPSFWSNWEVSQRTIYVGSVAELRASTIPAGTVVMSPSTKWIIGTDANGESIQGGLYAEPLSSICLDDYGFTSATDSAAEIQRICTMAFNFGVTRVYAKTSANTFKLQDTVDLSGISNLDLDFGGSLIIDDVQGFIPASANRAKQTFIIYNGSGVKLRGINFQIAPTRAGNASSVLPDTLIWVGGQYLGSEITENAELRDIVFNGTVFGNMPVSVLGELKGFTAKNIDVYGDASYGINFEYGLQPEDPATDPTLTNGRHPYNAKVENFNGYNLLNCSGFLRVASCYNIKFKNCQMYNVKSAIYCYSGDRNISRFSENVRFVNCKSKVDETVMTSVNYGIQVIMVNEDGSTGDPLPSWTNYDHQFQFDNCEIWNNTTLDSACVRFVGNQGETTFNNCLFKRSYYGLRAEPSTNPSYRSKASLTFNQCDFQKNYQDARINGIDGVIFQGNTKFRKRVAGSTLPQVSLGANDAVNHSKFIDCFFGEQSASGFFVEVVSGTNNHFVRNNFDLFSVGDISIDNSVPIYGQGNRTNGRLVDTANTKFRMIGEDVTGFKDTSGLSGNSVDYLKADKFLANSTLVLDFCLNGKDGDRVAFRGGTAGSSITFNHATTGTGRFSNKSGVNDVESGNDWGREYIFLNGIWYQV